MRPAMSYTDSMEASSCCDMMAGQVGAVCDQHDSPFDCPDRLVYFDQERQRYGLIVHDGGTGSISISFCPWCGRDLRDTGDKMAGTVS